MSEDYWSDEFIVQACAEDQGRATKRPRCLQPSQLDKQAKLDLERAQLAHGLAQPVSKQNKGYAMLAKMAGSEEKLAAVFRDPISPPVVHQPRHTSSDHDDAAKEDLGKEQEEAFRVSQVQKFENRRAYGQLMKIRRVEENLGIPQDINQSQEQDVDQEATTSATTASGQLQEPDYGSMVTDRVRRLRQAPFCYCFYCGCKYHDEQDLLDHCPGQEEKDHD